MKMHLVDRLSQAPGDTRLGVLLVVLIGVALGLWRLWSILDRVDHPPIKGLATIPGAKPIVGHLPLLGGAQGQHDATVWTWWAKKYNAPLFQLRFGNRRIVVANTFAVARLLAAGANGSALSSRPRHPIMERTFGLGVGGQPMSDRLRRMRTAALKSVARSMWPLLDPGLRYQTSVMEMDLIIQGSSGTTSLDPFPLVQKLTMNLSFGITYGVQMDSTEDPTYRGILEQAAAVGSIQSVTKTWANFLPILMWTPQLRRKLAAARRAQAKRAAYQSELLNRLLKRIEMGKRPNGIAASLLLDTETNSTAVDSVCRAMLQGGVETIAGSLVGGLGSLAVNSGQRIQETTYNDILKQYGDIDTAWANAFNEEKVPYLTALYKECLRFYTVSAAGLPHETMRDIRCGDIVIPEGTTVYFNNEGINHDEEFYKDANVFRPERWFEEPLASSPGIGHVAYGAGPRICPAMHISNHIMYAVLMRLILDFRIVADEKAPPVIDGAYFGAGLDGLNKTPFPFKLYFKPRDDAVRRRVQVELEMTQEN